LIREEILKEFIKKNVLITGGSGLIGRQIVSILCSAGANVKIASLDRISIHQSARHIYGDLTNFEFCKEVTNDMDYVFHLAGIKASAKISETKLASHFVPALMFNTNVLEACRINKVNKVIFTSSIGAYTGMDVFREADYKLDSIPMDFGGWAKRIAELQIYAYKKEYGLENYSIVRPSNVYGPGDNFDPENAMVIPSLMSRIHNGENPLAVWGDGSSIRDFAYSRDVAEGVILALHHGTKEHPFVNLGSGKEFTIRELVETLRNFLEFDYCFDASKPAGFPKRVMDVSLARKIIEYNPTTTLLEGLKETWDWFINNKEEYLLKKNYFK
jgi:GDP-L-fucose synthase